MRICAIQGDIADEAPLRADLVGLWLHGGDSTRNCLWSERFHRAYGARLRWVRSISTNPRSSVDPQFSCDLGRPWSSQADKLLECKPKQGTLQYLYIFANHADEVGYAQPEQVRQAVLRIMRAAADLEVQRIALLNILLAARSGDPTRHDAISARIMIETLQDWDRRNPGLVTDIFLVDLKGVFSSIPLI